MRDALEEAGRFPIPFGLVLKWGLGVIALILVLSVVLVPVSCGLAWFRAGSEIVGPANVREQFRFFYDTIEQLDAQGREVCLLEELVAGADGVDVRVQREQQLLAARAVYLNVKADYDARAQDVFRGGIVRPRDLPERAPALEEATGDC
jgi:hypothetical protein